LEVAVPTSRELLAEALGGHAVREELWIGPVDVVFGALGGAWYTVACVPGAGARVIVGTSDEGWDVGELYDALVADGPLRAALEAASGVPLDDECVEAGLAAVAVSVPSGVSEPSLLAPVVRRLAELIDADPQADVLCARCAAVDAPLRRHRHETLRLCDACAQVDLDEEVALDEVRDRLERPTGAGAAPLELPDGEEGERLAQLAARFEAEHATAPARYRARLLVWVLLGRSMLWLGPVVVVALLGALGVGAGLFLSHSEAWEGLATREMGGRLIVTTVFFIALLSSLVGGLARALRAVLRGPSLDDLEGTSLGRDDAPRLFSWLDGLSTSMRAPRVDRVMVMGAVNAFATERRRGLWRRERVVGLGTPLLEVLAVDELRAVLAHELGHLRARDVQHAWVYRTAMDWTAVAASAGPSPGDPFKRFARWFVPRFLVRASVVNREQERLADAASVREVGAEAAARALTKVHTVSAVFGELLEEGARLVGLGLAEAARRPVDLLRVGLRRWPDAAERALEDALLVEPHWADAHPRLVDRLEAIGVPAERRWLEELAPESPAWSLVDGYDDLAALVEVADRQRCEIGVGAAVRIAERRRRQVARLRLELEQAPTVRKRVRLARLLFVVDEDAAAIEAYGAVLDAEPGHVGARMELAEVFATARRPEDAVRELDRAIAARPELDVRLAAARVAERAGANDAAIRYLELALPDLEGDESLEEVRAQIELLARRATDLRKVGGGGGHPLGLGLGEPGAGGDV
jgi:Zn-dependent protease with chaperone function